MSSIWETFFSSFSKSNNSSQENVQKEKHAIVEEKVVFQEGYVWFVGGISFKHN